MCDGEKIFSIEVDQFTVTIFPMLIHYCALMGKLYIDSTLWMYAVRDIINHLVASLRLNDVMGADLVTMSTGKTHGYDCAESVGTYDIAICWHSSVAHHDMGLSLRFGATDWHVYCDNWETMYGTRMTFWRLWHMLSSSLYTMRISRLDIAADFFNFDDVSPHSLYAGIEDGTLSVLTDEGHIPCRTRRGYTSDGICETLEVGSRHSDVFLVAYDKRLQSIRLHGPFYNTALSCRSWLRLETRYKHNLAHAIGRDMTQICDDDTYLSYLAQKSVERFGFYTEGDDSDETD